MNQRVKLLILFVGLLLVGCSSESLPGKKPPDVFIEWNKEKFETVLGTYCWNSGKNDVCVDTTGPKDLLEGKKRLRVKAGDRLKLVMDYEPKPNEISLTQMSGEQEKKVVMTNQYFTAPTEKGLYYYSYSVWWMDEKEKNVSKGDAHYAFALEVY
ncbi:hypothetical protein [Bacillus massiliigorillae]|uniref:hypothetical protein n=1 Tax=Bacillus massiliigorillae TaxID=1243664 RepID=UPI0003A9D129|nr:hypothetical protein [Bacillus massiliigorillae]